MARAYSDDLRGRVLDAALAGAAARSAAARSAAARSAAARSAAARSAAARSAAARFGVGVATAIAWVARARKGERSARRQGAPRRSRLDAHAVFVEGLIEQQKDITLNEMVARLDTERAVSIGRSALSDWLRGRGWTFKKSPHMHWSKIGPTC